MEHMTFPVKLIAGISIAAAILAGCNNNDKSSNTETTSSASDTLNTFHVDSTGTNTMSTGSDTGSMRNDSGMAAPSVTDTSAMRKMKGAAKPNASKKGMKGKTTITLPTKLTGAVAPDARGVYANVDYIPSFPGGNKGLQEYFDRNLIFPQEASDNGVEGTVRVAFTIDENGRVVSPMIEGGSQGYGMDEEALAVIRKMPTWNPGKVKGKPVKTRFVLPVNFQLN